MAIAAITASELLVGIHRATSQAHRVRRSAFVEGALAELPVLAFDLDVARVHASLSAGMSASGQVIGSHDLLIAATALANNYDVLTTNVRDFSRVPGLVVREPSW
jgi:predicted nucleic acid-binding protein